MVDSLLSKGKKAKRESLTQISHQTGIRRAASVGQGESFGADSCVMGDLDSKSTFSIVIIHEDGLTARRAQHFYNGMIHDLAEVCHFKLDRWSFRAISIPEIRDLALQLAGQADFVILSIRGKVKLPIQIKDWIDQWSSLMTDSKPALIALFDPPNRRERVVASVIKYLHNIADRNNIDFFPHTNFRVYAD
jgi:hypothetical protein